MHPCPRPIGLFCALLLAFSGYSGERSLDYAPAAVDNPLKGLVPYRGKWPGRFPHSMDSGLFEKKTDTAERHKRAAPMVQRMGYELHVPKVEWQQKGPAIEVDVSVKNRGVAPFYYDWPVEFALLDASGIVHSISSKKGKDWHAFFLTPKKPSGSDR